MVFWQDIFVLSWLISSEVCSDVCWFCSLHQFLQYKINIASWDIWVNFSCYEFMLLNVITFRNFLDDSLGHLIWPLQIQGSLKVVWLTDFHIAEPEKVNEDISSKVIEHFCVWVTVAAVAYLSKTDHTLDVSDVIVAVYKDIKRLIIIIIMIIRDWLG